jgi:two-component system, OmpR family, KDP operon response regulator KdpE
LPTIFVIDDDISALTSIVSTLTTARYEVQQVRSTDQARHYLDDNDPDLILLEVDTDRGKGWDLLRDIVRFEGAPTIVVSHRGREEEIVEALNIGAVDFLPKPFRTNELLARVRTRLGVPAEDAPVAPVAPPVAAPVRRSAPL